MKKWFIYTGIVGAWITASAFLNVSAAWEIPQIECEYAGKFEQCMIANQNGNARSIENFSCLQSTDPARILDQIILDVKFREIQEKSLEFLVRLKKDKEAVIKDQNRIIDDVTKNFWKQWVYYKEYQKLCKGWILAERISCTEKIANPEAGLRIKWSNLTESCMRLANTNLDIYTQVAYDTLKLNKSQIHEDNKKKYMQKERKKYDGILNLMLDIVGHMWRLARWLTHYTQTTKK